MMKKIIALLLALAMVMSLAACSGGGSTGSAAVQPEAAAPAATEAVQEASFYEVTEPIEIIWWHSLEDQYSELIAEVVDGFNASQDLITVKAEYIGALKDLNEKLVATNAAGTGLPAVCTANTDYVASYGENGVFENLDGYIAATGYDIEDFSTGLVLSTQYNGTQVAMPFTPLRSSTTTRPWLMLTASPFPPRSKTCVHSWKQALLPVAVTALSFPAGTSGTSRSCT